MVKVALTVIQHHLIHWEACSDGEVPQGAIAGGKSVTGEVLYIGRARLMENKNELTPGVVIPSEKCLELSYGTGVRKKSRYEVLVSQNPQSYCWVPCMGSTVPRTAVIGGLDCSYLEPLYIGRTNGCLSNGRTWRGQRLKIPGGIMSSTSEELSQIPGKVHRSHKCLYIPFMEREYLFREYEVLVLKKSPDSLSAFCRAAIRDSIAQSLTPSLATDCYVAESIDKLVLPSKLKEYCKAEENFFEEDHNFPHS